MTIHGKYIEKLNSMPAPGTGCHPSLLSAANLGVLADIPPEEIFSEIRGSIPAGKRKVSDKEINEAIIRAAKDNCNITLPNGERYRRYIPPKSKAIIKDSKATLQRILEQSNISEEVDLWEKSPIRIDWTPEDDKINFLLAMFEPSDLLFIGERLEPGIIGQNIRTAAAWIKFFQIEHNISIDVHRGEQIPERHLRPLSKIKDPEQQPGGKTAPFIIINPLTGKPAPKKDGDGETFRGDNNINSFRYCLVEFDNLTIEEQIRFWTAAKLPIMALVDSGGKSIHGWIKLSNINSISDWQREIKQKLYDQYLIPLGVDPACSNPARLSRLPGHLREKGKYQKILWLNIPEKDGDQ